MTLAEEVVSSPVNVVVVADCYTCTETVCKLDRVEFEGCKMYGVRKGQGSLRESKGVQRYNASGT
jgi:hypothetical protein